MDNGISIEVAIFVAVAPSVVVYIAVCWIAKKLGCHDSIKKLIR